VQGADRVGAALAPLAKVAAQKVNVDRGGRPVTAGTGRFGMIFWVAPRHYARAARALGAR
jgi:hypothetical protein